MPKQELERLERLEKAIKDIQNKIEYNDLLLNREFLKLEDKVTNHIKKNIIEKKERFLINEGQKKLTEMKKDISKELTMIKGGIFLIIIILILIFFNKT